MIVSTKTYPSPVHARKLAPKAALRKPAEAPNAVPLDSVTFEGAKRHSRLIGSVGKFIAKIPKFLAHTGRFLGATLFGGLSAAIQVAAGSLGLVGMAGLGLAGVLEIRDGIKERDGIKVMSGSGEIVRGAFTGLLSAEHLVDMGQHAGLVSGLTAGLGALQVGIHATSGTLKFLEGRKTDNRRRRIEGLLEVGMGAASLGMIAGPLTPFAVGTYAGLATAKYGVANWEKLKAGAVKLKELGQEYWQTMRSEYRGLDAFKEPDKNQALKGYKMKLLEPKPEPTLAEQCREIF